jgi:23S rRNA pseudouridine2605 synthase
MPENGTHDKHGERIAKVIARAGLASRREAEAWIAAGRVAVNGAAIASPALNVTARDRITIDGAPLPARARTRLFLYHKPRGLVTTHADPQGRDTIFRALPQGLPRLISVGRLDINTEGLLLLTNDGGLARVLELPATGWLRRYRVRALGRVTQEALDRLKGGVSIDGMRYGPIEATLDREQGANVWLSFAIKEGKNREVRKVLERLGLKVNRLIRLSYGPFELGGLDDGAVQEVETAELRKALGPDIVKQAEADFVSPLEDETVRRPEARAKRASKDDGERRERERKKKPPRRDRRGGPRPSRPRPK